MNFLGCLWAGVLFVSVACSRAPVDMPQAQPVTAAEEFQNEVSGSWLNCQNRDSKSVLIGLGVDADLTVVASAYLYDMPNCEGDYASFELGDFRSKDIRFESHREASSKLLLAAYFPREKAYPNDPTVIEGRIFSTARASFRVRQRGEAKTLVLDLKEIEVFRDVPLQILELGISRGSRNQSLVPQDRQLSFLKGELPLPRLTGHMKSTHVSAKGSVAVQGSDAFYKEVLRGTFAGLVSSRCADEYFKGSPEFQIPRPQFGKDIFRERKSHSVLMAQGFEIAEYQFFEVTDDFLVPYFLFDLIYQKSSTGELAHSSLACRNSIRPAGVRIY